MIWLTVICAALFFVLSAFSCAFADVIINEVMASNGFYENGEAYDWIELYNDGKKAVDLGGGYLSDSKKNPLKWSGKIGFLRMFYKTLHSSIIQDRLLNIKYCVEVLDQVWV